MWLSSLMELCEGKRYGETGWEFPNRQAAVEATKRVIEYYPHFTVKRRRNRLWILSQCPLSFWYHLRRWEWLWIERFFLHGWALLGMITLVLIVFKVHDLVGQILIFTYAGLLVIDGIVSILSSIMMSADEHRAFEREKHDTEHRFMETGTRHQDDEQ